jgi:hypothetical protein
LIGEQRDLTVGDADDECAPGGMDHGDRRGTTERLPSGNRDDTSTGTGTAFPDTSGEAGREEQQSNDYRNRQDES